MRRDNKGLSLIEVILVVAILGILSTGGVAMYNSLGFANTKKAAKQIDEAMSKTRLHTMSKKDMLYLYIYNLSDNVYIKLSTEANPALADLDDTGTRFSKNISLSYKSTSSEEDLTPGNNICINFDRGSGAFKTDYEYIKLGSGNDASKIICVKETGRHFVE